MGKASEHSAYVELRQLVAELPIGISQGGLICPFCRGGKNEDRAFSVTRTSEAEAKYCCHRATCGKAGRLEAWGFRLRQIGDNSSSNASMPKFTPRVYRGETTQLGEGWLSEILGRYELSGEEAAWAGWSEDSGDGRLVCRVFSPYSMARGVELRQSKERKHPKSSPKTDYYRAVDEIWMGWYRRITSGPIIVVEDVVSALKAARHAQAVSIMGSHLSLEHVLEIVEIAGDNPVFIALDKDATHKAEKYILQWRLIAPNFRLFPLSKDLKYLTDDEIKRITDPREDNNKNNGQSNSKDDTNH